VPTANRVVSSAAAVIMAVVALCGCKKPPSMDAATPTIELARAGAPVALTKDAERALVVHVEKALAVCNFRSDRPAHAFVFGGADGETRWKNREAASHLRLRYPKPIAIASVAGTIEADEVLLSVDEPYGPEPALIKHAGTVLALKKCGYDDRMLGCDPALSAYFKGPPVCPPGF